MPFYALESRPGDAVFFCNQLWHAAIGGPRGRRIFAISFKAAPANDGQRMLADYKTERVKECREAKPVVA